MRRNNILRFTVVLMLCLVSTKTDSKFEMSDHPFDKILKILGVPSQHGISLPFLDKLTSTLFGKFKCNSVTPTPQASAVCQETLCLNGSDIFTALSFASDKEVLKDDFGKVSNILAFYILTLQDNCHNHVVPSAGQVANLLSLIDSDKDSKIDFDELDDIFEQIENFYDDHDDDADSHGDSHDDDSHGDSNGDSHKDKHESGTDDHSDGSHTDDDEKQDSQSDGSHDDDGDKNNHTSSHDDDSHSDDEDDHKDEFESTTKENCISAGQIFDEIGEDDVETKLGNDALEEISILMVYHFLQGDSMTKNCRKLPRKRFFNKYLANIAKVQNEYFEKDVFSQVYKALGFEGGESHVEDNHDGHGHDRRKRAALSGLEAESKAFEQPKCYGPGELLSIYGAKNATAIPQQVLFDLCPSLLYLKLSNACLPESSKKKAESTMPSDAQRYGYGSLAVLIICLCSLGGVIVIGCTENTACFSGTLACFIGLAVGTLITDAVLHLIPTAFGLHLHSDEEGHDHSNEPIVVEAYVWYGLATLAAIYSFYLLELIMTFLRDEDTSEHGHSHVPKDMELGMHKKNGYGSNASDVYMVDSRNNVSTSDLEPPAKTKSWTSVVIMVIVGDGIHNFADGLAIGAAFSQSATAGLATSIAVFCHELPHELGDFAILLNAGLSVKRALFLNFLSALSAFIGLYVGLSISSNDATRQWIFAITAGLFIYLAMVDLVPEMIRGAGANNRHRKFNVILHNIGLYIGALVLVLLAIFEERIKI